MARVLVFRRMNCWARRRRRNALAGGRQAASLKPPPNSCGRSRRRSRRSSISIPTARCERSLARSARETERHVILSHGVGARMLDWFFIIDARLCHYLFSNTFVEGIRFNLHRPHIISSLSANLPRTLPCAPSQSVKSFNNFSNSS